MNKRILIFTVSYYPHVGGAEVAIKEITDRIDPNDIVFDMVTMRFIKKNNSVEKLGNISINRIGFTDNAMQSTDRLPLLLKITKILFPLIAFLKAYKLQKKHSYDAVWVNMANHSAFAALLFKYFYPKISYILMLQDGQTVDEIKKKNKIVRLLYPFYIKVFTKADYIQAISNFTKNLALNMGATCPIELISNGVNVKHFSKVYAEEELDKLRVRLNLKRNKRYIITTSRLVMNRGVEDIIKSLKFIPQHVEFLVLGVGDDLEELKKIAREVGVSERVHFLEHISHSELPKYLKVADIFVRPSIVEGFGNSFIEAMVAEIPVIATEVGGIPDFLYDPKVNPDKNPTGLFCKAHNPKSIAEQVIILLEDSVLVEKLKKNASLLVKERYDWSKITQDMKEKIFNKIEINK